METVSRLAEDETIQITPDNAWLSVTRTDRCVQVGDRQPVDLTFESANVTDSVVAIVLSENLDRILTIRQYRPVIDQMNFEFPAGGIGENETPIQAAIREVAEETGVRTEEYIPFPFPSLFVSPGYSTEKVTFVTLRALDDQIAIDQSDDENKTIFAEWLSVMDIDARLDELMNAGHSLDFKTLFVTSVLVGLKAFRN